MQSTNIQTDRQRERNVKDRFELTDWQTFYMCSHNNYKKIIFYFFRMWRHCAPNPWQKLSKFSFLIRNYSSKNSIIMITMTIKNEEFNVPRIFYEKLGWIRISSQILGIILFDNFYSDNTFLYRFLVNYESFNSMVMQL